MRRPASAKLQSIETRAKDVAERVAAPHADAVDRDKIWPEHTLAALGEAGLLGLHVPERLGGLGEGLTALATVTEILGQSCSSSALVYAMHCVGTAVIAAKPTRYQEENYLRPIAAARHITTLSLSEAATGVHFYLPQTRLERVDDTFHVFGSKQFVTSAGYADSYVVSTTASDPEAESGEFSCVLVDREAPGLQWTGEWNGIGMRGNSSRGMLFDGVTIPAANLLGHEGDQIWYVFEVVAPYFIIAMAGTYLGIAEAALSYVTRHMQARSHAHNARPLAHNEVLQQKLAELWIAVEQARLLVYEAAAGGDLGDPQALVPILASKAAVSDVAVMVVNEAMTLSGGIAYAENDKLARLLRDVRAAHIMSPSTLILKSWTARALLGLPLLD